MSIPYNNVIILMVLSVINAYYIHPLDPVVKGTGGLILGSWKESSNGRRFASFRGIPYARPPIGKYRFKDPEPATPWTGVLNATEFGSDCLQYNQDLNPQIRGSEDCLFVNVYTPSFAVNASLPVVVFIHGGAFMYGGGTDYRPDSVMNRDIVAVTFNYRLGPLGFLSTGDEVISGNFGLKDQSLVLHWIQENIATFAGNPDNVILTGNSAGGASVHYHFLSPLSQGTFNKGISFSGSAFSSWAHQYSPEEKAKIIASIVECPTRTSSEMAECLLATPGEKIIQAQVQMFPWRVHKFTPFTPSTESAGVSKPFFAQYPFFATEAGQMAKLPLIVSVCAEEGIYPAAAYQRDPDAILPELERRWDELASHIFQYNDTLPVARRPEVARLIRERYLNGKHISQDTFQQLIQAFSDRFFNTDVATLAQMHAKKSGQPVYVYRFAFQGDFSLSFLLANNTNTYGVSHADDILHIWNADYFKSPADFQMTERLLDMLYSYATTGIPQYEGVDWTPMVPDSPEVNYLEITAPDTAQMKTKADFGNKTFWDNIGFNENKNYKL